MVLWVYSAISLTNNHVDYAITDDQKAAATLGKMLGAGVLISLWGIGDVILGLFVFLTRRKKIITSEE